MSEEVELPPLVGYNDDYYDGGKSLHESELSPYSHIGIRERQLRKSLTQIAALTKQVEELTGSIKMPWDMPSSDRSKYEELATKEPSTRSLEEGLIKKYADISFAAIASADALRLRAEKAEAELAALREGAMVTYRIDTSVDGNSWEPLVALASADYSIEAAREWLRTSCFNYLRKVEVITRERVLND